jgi:hypothetical protein
VDLATVAIMDIAEIVRFLEGTPGPRFSSSDLEIVEKDGGLTIQSPALPMRFIRWWMVFTLLVMIGLAAWLEPDYLWWVLLMGPPALIGFLLVMRTIEQERIKAGPQAIIGQDIVSFSGVTIPRAAAKELLEVYFQEQHVGQRLHRRVVLVYDGVRLVPILWQIASRSTWTKPTLAELSKRLGIPAESVDLPAKISRAPFKR